MQHANRGRRLLSRLGAFDPFDVAAVLLLLGVAVLVAHTYPDYGISNDEEVQQQYAELIIRYYQSGFTDRSCSTSTTSTSTAACSIDGELPHQDAPARSLHVRHLLCAASASAASRRPGPPPAWSPARAPALSPPWRSRVRTLVRRHVQPYQGHHFRRRHDGRHCSCCAPGARAAAPALARRDAVWRAARRRARPARDSGCSWSAISGWRSSWRPSAPRPRCATGWPSSGDRASPLPGPRHCLSDHDRGWPWAALGPLNPCARSSRSPTLTIRSSPCSTAKCIRWGRAALVRADLPRNQAAADHVRRCRAGACLRRRLPAGGARAQPPARREIGLLAFMAAFPVLLPGDRSRPGLHRHAPFPVRGTAARGARRHRLRARSLSVRRIWRRAAPPASASPRSRRSFWNADVLRAAASLRIPLLQRDCRRAEGRGRPLRYRLLGEHDAGGGARAGGLSGAHRAARRALRHRPTVSRSSPSGSSSTIPRDEQLHWTKDWDHADFFIAPTHMNGTRWPRARPSSGSSAWAP